ncbi:hypothetical protein ACTFIU_000174 [Dictyostelium citrinum]
MEPKEGGSPQATTLKRNKDKTMAKTFKKILKPGEKKKKQKAIVTAAIKQLIHYLETNCIELEGICRISGNNTKVKELKKQLENGEGDSIDFSKIDSHCVSGALKAFLRDSDEPLLSFDLYKNFLASIDIKDKNSKISFIKSLLSALPKENYDLLQILLKFLHTIQLHSSINKMTSSNLAIVFSPTLLRPKEESLESMMTDSNSISEVVRVLIEEFHVLYEIKQTLLYQVSAIDLGIKEDKRSTSEQLEDAKVTIEQLKKHLNEEARERSILETYCTSMEQKLQELEDINKSLIEEKDSLGELLNEFKETNKNQANDITSLKNDIKDVTEKQTKTELESKNYNFLPIIIISPIILSICCFYLYKNNNSVHQHIDNIIDNHLNFENIQRDELNKVKVKLEKDIETTRVELKSANDECQKLKVNNNKLGEDIKNQTKEFEQTRKSLLENHKSDIENLKKSEFEKHQLEIQQFRQENEQLKKEKTDANLQVERVQAEISILLSSSNDKNSKKNSLKNQKKDLDNALKKCKDQESKINQLEKEKSKLQDELTKLQKSSSSSSSSSSSQQQNKFIFGKKPSSGKITTTTTTTTTTQVQPTTPPPPLDEDDIVSVKKFAFYYMNLAIKTDAMTKGLPCNINSSDILEELLSKNIKVQHWSEVISKKLKENK